MSTYELQPTSTEAGGEVIAVLSPTEFGVTNAFTFAGSDLDMNEIRDVFSLPEPPAQPAPDMRIETDIELVWLKVLAVVVGVAVIVVSGIGLGLWLARGM